MNRLQRAYFTAGISMLVVGGAGLVTLVLTKSVTFAALNRCFFIALFFTLLNGYTVYLIGGMNAKNH